MPLVRSVDTNAPAAPARPRRRRYGYTATREAILATARALMREDGVGAMNLSEVARRMGMRTPSLYTYFDSKHALYDALFHDGMLAFRRRLDEVAQRHKGRALLAAVIEDYMRFADENPELYALMFERPVPGFVPSAESMTTASALLDDAYALMGALLDSGAIASGLGARETADLFFAMVHGLAALKRANEPDAPIGSGRFASLIPQAAALLEAAWVPREAARKGGAA